MKTRYLAFLALLFAPLFIAATCSPQRPLDQAGAYAGDTVLYDLDGVIEETTAVFDQVIAWADRNAAYVGAHDNIAAQVAKIRAELDGQPQPHEMLTRLFAVRDAYTAARSETAAADVRREIAIARTALAAARHLIASQPSTP